MSGKGEASWAREPEGDSEIERNWLFTLGRERFRSRASGKAHDFYVVRLADSVNVIAVTPDRRLVMVEQFRAGSVRDSLETPGGLIDAGEDPLEAAARELLEETGYAGDPPRLLGVVWSNPSILTARSYTVLIDNVSRTADPKPDAGEEVRLELVPARRVPELIRNGRIGHALAVQGLLWWLASELPESPFEESAAGARRKTQVNLGQLMGVVAGCAVLFAVIRVLAGFWAPLGGPLLYVGAVVPAWLLVSRWIDPKSRAVLLRGREMTATRLIQRMFTFLGVYGVVLLAAMIAWAVAMGLL